MPGIGVMCLTMSEVVIHTHTHTHTHTTHTYTHMVDLAHGATVPVFEDLDVRNPQTLSPGAKSGRDFQKSAPQYIHHAKSLWSSF
jgi:hypothetical protein